MRTLIAALIITALAHPLLNPQTRLTGDGPVALVGLNRAAKRNAISWLSLSSLTIQFFNGGSPVARSGVNIDVEGF